MAHNRVPLAASILVLAAGGATILGALGFEHLGGYLPCALCLKQRLPYYAGLPIATVLAAGLLFRIPKAVAVGGFLLLAALFVYGSGLGVYHAGIEWGFWTGPDCAATGFSSGMSGADLLSQLNKIIVVPCDRAAWRLFGISMAGYNAAISAGLALVSLIGAYAIAKKRVEGKQSA